MTRKKNSNACPWKTSTIETYVTQYSNMLLHHIHVPKHAPAVLAFGICPCFWRARCTREQKVYFFTAQDDTACWLLYSKWQLYECCLNVMAYVISK